jgi:hypothetical protein
MARFAYGTPQSDIDNYYRTVGPSLGGTGPERPLSNTLQQSPGSPGFAQPRQQQSQGTPYNPQGNALNMSAYGGGQVPQDTIGNGWAGLNARLRADPTGGGQPQFQGTPYNPQGNAPNMSAYGGGQVPQATIGNGWAGLQSRINDGYWGDVTGGGQPQNMGQQQQGGFSGFPQMPAFEFRGTDFMGNQFNNPTAMTNQQGAMTQALNQQRAGQIGNLFTQGTPMSALDPMAAYQQGQQMLQGGFQNPFAEPVISPQPGQQPSMGQQPGGQFQDLFQQFGFAPPPGFMDALIQRLGGQQGPQPGFGQPGMGQQPGQGFLGRPTGPAQPGGQWRPGDDVPIWGAPGGSHADAVRDRQDPNKVHGGITLQESDRRRDVNRALELSEKMNVGVAESEVKDFLDFYRENHFRIARQYDPTHGDPRGGPFIPPTPEQTARARQMDQQIHQNLANLWNQQQGRQPLNRSPQPPGQQPGFGQPPMGQPGRAQPTPPPSQGTPYRPGFQPPQSPYDDYQRQQRDQRAETERQGLAAHLLGNTQGTPVTDSQILRAMFPESGGINPLYGGSNGREQLPNRLRDAGLISDQDARQLASELERYGDNARMQQQSQLGRNAQIGPNHPAYRENMEWAAQDRWNAENGLMAMLPRRAAYADFLVNQQGVSQAEARRMAEQQYPVRSREDEIRGLTLNLQSINEQLRQEPPPRVGNAAFGITPPVSPLEQQRRELSDQLARLQGRPTEQEAAAQRARQQQQQMSAEAARAERMRQAELEARGITKEMQAKYTPQQINNILRTGNSNAAILVRDPQKPGRVRTLTPGQPGYAQAAAGDMSGAWRASDSLYVK